MIRKDRLEQIKFKALS